MQSQDIHLSTSASETVRAVRRQAWTGIDDWIIDRGRSQPTAPMWWTENTGDPTLGPESLWNSMVFDLDDSARFYSIGSLAHSAGSLASPNNSIGEVLNIIAPSSVTSGNFDHLIGLSLLSSVDRSGHTSAKRELDNAKIIKGPWIQGEYEKLIVQLERLRDGWAGVASCAPSSATLCDLRKLIVTLQASARVPDVEVDSDGSIDLFWARDGGTFSLSLSGNGSVMAVLVETEAEHDPWKIDVDDEVSLAEIVENDVVALLVAK